MAGPLLIRHETLTFDLSAVYSPNLLSRLRAALNVGLAAASQGPSISNLISMLTRISERTPVRFFSEPREWSPNANVRTTAVTTWTDRLDHIPRTVQEILAARSGVRVLMLDLGQPYWRVLDTCWHELLHPAVPFTHTQDNLSDEQKALVDDAKWLSAINALHHDFPAVVVDPVTNKPERLDDYQWSMNPNCCLLQHRTG